MNQMNETDTQIDARDMDKGRKIWDIIYGIKKRLYSAPTPLYL